ncbi:hypothetical protein HHK36_003736 [Tetracentron sinense]|uniref:Cell wall protein n=1 Tax=Tetracentron sinense TaxID=13715 RepID=A0A835DNW0_TETSI|nr:hypothetical protein HHK36_003736 [Tetracentron sinense]
MAYNSYFSLLLVFSILLAITQVTVVGRDVPGTPMINDKKHPEWFIEPDGSVLIPGIGRVMVPSLGGASSYTPYMGGSGGTGSSLPGGDDTFAPPIDIPNPAGGGGIPASASP